MRWRWSSTISVSIGRRMPRRSASAAREDRGVVDVAVRGGHDGADVACAEWPVEPAKLVWVMTVMSSRPRRSSTPRSGASATTTPADRTSDIRRRRAFRDCSATLSSSRAARVYAVDPLRCLPTFGSLVGAAAVLGVVLPARFRVMGVLALREDPPSRRTANFLRASSASVVAEVGPRTLARSFVAIGQSRCIRLRPAGRNRQSVAAQYDRFIEPPDPQPRRSTARRRTPRYVDPFEG